MQAPENDNTPWPSWRWPAEPPTRLPRPWQALLGGLIAGGCAWALCIIALVLES